MAIKGPAAPEGGFDLVADNVAHLMSRGPGNRAPIAGGAVEAVAPFASQPIRLFTLRLDAIVGDDFLGKAVPIGWRYLIIGDEPIAVADVKQAQPGGPISFSRLTRGPIAERLYAATHLVEKMYGDSPGVVEARMLEIPALYESALWLHGEGETFIPLVDADASKSRALAPDKEFLERILKMAEAKRSPVRGARLP